MTTEFATRIEVNGLGARLNAVSETVAAHKEAQATVKENLRDLWAANAHSKAEDGRIETMVHGIAKDVARQNVLFLIANAVIVALIVKYLGGQ